MDAGTAGADGVRRDASDRLALHAGLGWRQPHYAALLAQKPALSFLEVHSENFFAPGGASRAVLQAAREHYPISLHGVGLSLGSASGVDPWHLDRLAELVDWIDPVRVSDHASFARAPLHAQGPVVHGNDLLPVAFTPASLALMAANVDRVQDRLRRPLLVENLSAYLRWADDAISEPEFFNELTRRTGCGVLLDVNNLVVNALNAGCEPVAAACAWIDAVRADAVGEIHLAGYCDGRGDGGGPALGPSLGWVIDDHSSRVHPPVWAVYRHALRHVGTCPTLVEWDTDIPDLSVLLGEVALAEQALHDHAQGGVPGQGTAS